MHPGIERRLDAQLARISNQIRHIRELDLLDEASRQQALEESLEALRALTLYRGMLKNVSEQHFNASNEAFHRALDDDEDNP